MNMIKKMKQSKLESWVEVFFNYATGFIVAWLTYAFIVMPNLWLKNSPFWVTVLFTVISVFRTFFWRRFFNNGLHKAVHKFIGKYFKWLRKKKL